MLVNILKPDFIFEDDRGTLVQLVHKGYNQINVIKSNKGVIRGGHYHNLNNEAFYIISGRLKLSLKQNGYIENYEFRDGDMFKIISGISHSFEFLEDTLLVSMYDKGVELNDKEKDIIVC